MSKHKLLTFAFLIFFISPILHAQPKGWKPYSEEYAPGVLKTVGFIDKKERKQGEWNYYNQLGDLIRTEHYTDDQLVDSQSFPQQSVLFDEAGRVKEVREMNFEGVLEPYLFAIFFKPDPEKEQLIYKYAYDEAGRLSTIKAYNAFGKECDGIRGYSTEQYSYTEAGQIEKLCYLRVNGRPGQDVMGQSCKLYFYTKQGDLERIEFRDSLGRLTESDVGAASIEYHYDEQNRLTEILRLDMERNLAVWDVNGMPRQVISYDPEIPGMKKSVFYLKNREEPYAGLRQYEDGRGNRIREEYFPKPDSAGFSAYIEYDLDEDGVRIGEREYKGDGTLEKSRSFGVTLSVPGWELEDPFPDLLKGKVEFGKVAFQIEVNDEGRILSAKSKSWRGTALGHGNVMDYLHKLRLKRVSDTPDTKGTILFLPPSH